MMDWAEKERCVLCNKGGKLLVCNDEGCPISVHTDCMGCKAWFDDIGNFYCPYCVYRRLTNETRQLRDKAISAKKALSTFLGESEQIFSRERTCLESVSNPIGDGIKNQSIHLEKHQCSKSPLPCEGTHETSESEHNDQIPNRHGEISEIYNGNTCRIMVVYEERSKPTDTHSVDCVLCKERWVDADELKLGDCRGVQVKDRAGSAECKHGGVAELQHRAMFREKALQSNNLVISSSIQKQTTRRDAKPPLLGKRRVRWSDEEEDMLKEGVQKFSSTVQKNFPWKKVLEFGRHVFDESRTPSDLKDKWRNMTKQSSTK